MTARSKRWKPTGLTCAIRHCIRIEASEDLHAERDEGLNANRTALWHQQRQVNTWTTTQSNYSYKGRQLPAAVLMLDLGGLPNDVPAGFTALAARSVIASQFGMNDTQDEGTGSPVMGLIQTNSEVLGASVKVSVMKQVFGPAWRTNSKRFGALVEVYFPATRHLARVPLVDVGPGETIPAEIDLTWAVDQFLGTQGQADVIYRFLLPT